MKVEAVDVPMTSPRHTKAINYMISQDPCGGLEFFLRADSSQLGTGGNVCKNGKNATDANICKYHIRFHQITHTNIYREREKGTQNFIYKYLTCDFHYLTI